MELHTLKTLPSTDDHELSFTWQKKDTHSIEVSTFCRALQLPTAPVIHLRRHGESLVWCWSDPWVFHFFLCIRYVKHVPNIKQKYERRYFTWVDTFTHFTWEWACRTSVVAWSKPVCAWVCAFCLRSSFSQCAIFLKCSLMSRSNFVNTTMTEIFTVILV